MVVWLFLLLSCSASPGYEELTSFCSERTWEASESIYQVDISKDCAIAIVDTFSINEKSFGMRVDGIGDSINTMDVLIGGIHALVFTDLGSVGEMIEDPDAPGVLVDLANDQLAAGRVDVETGIGELITNFSTKEIRHVKADFSQESLMYMRRGKIFVGNLLVDEDPDLNFDVSIIYAAALFLHEVTHVYDTNPHVVIDDVEYDEDYERAYGASAYLGGLWWDSLDVDYRNGVNCLMYKSTMYHSCMHIVNPRGLCDDWLELYNYCDYH